MTPLTMREVLLFGILVLIKSSLCNRDRYVYCGEKLHGFHGQFNSPNYPSPYPNYLKCTWHLSVPNGYRVRLNFTQFELEWSDQCKFDYVKVQSRNGTMGKFCGRRLLHANGVSSGYVPPKEPFIAPDNALDVLLYTDYSNEVEFHGFQAHFVAIDVNECLTGNGGCLHFCHNFIGGSYCSCKLGYKLAEDGKNCIIQCRGIHLRKANGLIESPEYPLSYPPHAQCDWHITAEKGFVVVLDFEDFHVEDHHQAECPYDYVLIEDEGTKHGPFCGNKLPPSIKSKSNWLIFEFFSDKSHGGKGFKAKYRIQGCDCPVLETPANGKMLGHRNFTYQELLTFTCNWGYEIEGSISRRCQADGTWSGVMPKCNRIKCISPWKQNRGFKGAYRGWERDQLAYAGETVTPWCEPHFEPHGPKEAMCMPDRKWANLTFTCKQTCGTEIGFFKSMHFCDTGVSDRHIGDKDTWLWTAGLRYKDKLYCSGVLVHKQWVLTAAHCALDKHPNDVDVILGTINAQRMQYGTQVKKVTEFRMHGEFQMTNFRHDIALVKLDSPVKFTQQVQPICLPYTTTHKELFKPGARLATIGYSMDKRYENMVTQRCNEVQPYGKCLKYVNNISRIVDSTAKYGRPEVPHNSMVCTMEGLEPSDVCLMLPGSGMFARDTKTKKWYLGGLHSWAKEDCFYKGGKYNAFLKMSKYVNWILKETRSRIDKYGLHSTLTG